MHGGIAHIIGITHSDNSRIGKIGPDDGVSGIAGFLARKNAGIINCRVRVGDVFCLNNKIISITFHPYRCRCNN